MSRSHAYSLWPSDNFFTTQSLNLAKAIPNAKGVVMSRPSGHLINIHVPLEPSKPLCATQLTSDHEPVCV